MYRCQNSIFVESNGIKVVQDERIIQIDFEECARNSPITGNCVATRDITEFTFTFFTEPVTVINLSEEEFGISDDRVALQQFRDIRKQIEQCGYTTFDLS